MTEEQLRESFEQLAFQKYLYVVAVARARGAEVELLASEGLFWREPDGSYGVRAMNSAWWGFRAGAGGAAWANAEVAGLDPTPSGTLEVRH